MVVGGGTGVFVGTTTLLVKVVDSEVMVVREYEVGTEVGYSVVGGGTITVPLVVGGTVPVEYGVEVGYSVVGTSVVGYVVGTSVVGYVVGISVVG